MPSLSSLVNSLLDEVAAQITTITTWEAFQLRAADQTGAFRIFGHSDQVDNDITTRTTNAAIGVSLACNEADPLAAQLAASALWGQLADLLYHWSLCQADVSVVIDQVNGPVQIQQKSQQAKGFFVQALVVFDLTYIPE